MAGMAFANPGKMPALLIDGLETIAHARTAKTGRDSLWCVALKCRGGGGVCFVFEL